MSDKKYWEIEKVLDKRIDEQEGLLYLVHWHGYSREEATWISVSYFSENNFKLAEYEAAQVDMMDRQINQIEKLEGFIQNKITHFTAIADAVCESEKKNGVSMQIHYDANRHKIDDAHGYKCPKCAHTSTRRDHLNEHLKTHDVNRLKNHKCSVCNYSTDRKSNLERHVSKKHTD